MVFFRQCFDQTSSTYTYILGCEETKEALLIDPVKENAERDSTLLKELKLNPIYEIETHVHADHITGGSALRKIYPDLKQVLSSDSGVTFKDGLKLVEDGEKIKFGKYELLVVKTPGHTNGCMSLIFKDEMAFTGDALFIRGCGRTDFQQGNSHSLYQSVQKLFKLLPDSCLVYPGHDYKGQTATTIGEEKEYNPRLNTKNSEEDFVKIMNELKLADPKLIDIAVPANLKGGSD
eukprot:gene1805-947_t